MFNKFGELAIVGENNIHSTESVLAELNDIEINAYFKKFAAQLKRISPKADDFLYFSTRYITAAEAALINPDGTPKLDKQGNAVVGNWEKTGNSLKWVCSDPSIKPYKNQNGDIFPESELIKAHKKWIERPLCIDHRSDSVDAVRGIILDSYYDRTHKYAVALIALDKISFPELARGITSGYKTSVSMGTRVATAICYDCGQAANSERDFCQHMRTKSAWGEVNTGLDPIEISLVVSGADPQAKIRTILAAANDLRSSITEKEQEINKLSITQSSVSKFKELEDDLKNISTKLADLKADLEQNDENKTSDAAYGQTGNAEIIESDLPNTDANITFPARFANNNALRSELQDLQASVNSKFQEMEKSLLTLSHKIKEEIMSAKSNDGMNKEGYFQGAGGVNEPAPHQVKYPKDPLNEKDRMQGDKHMLGVDNMGGPDGMFPGDKEKKELVQRGEIEERSMRRAAALQKAKENLMESKKAYLPKEGYFQGGGDGDGADNEPTPGKRKYPVDPLNEKDRLKEDKQMVGKKPFPGVGDVDGLYDGDLKVKQLHNRASLKAKFVRVAAEDGTQDLGQSGWQVSRDNEVLFTATVEEISGGNVDGLYDTVASKEFGTRLLEKVYKVGAEKAASLYKSSQAVAGMGAEPAAPPDMGGAAPVPPMPDMSATPALDSAAPAPQDTGAEGDPKEVALKLAQEMVNRSSDLLEAVRVLTGEQSEMGELEGLTEKAASDLKPLVKMKKTLNASLIAGMKKAIAELGEHKEELSLISDILADSPTNSDYTNTIVEEAFVDAKAALAEVRDLMGAFITYAHGSEQLSKQAHMADGDFDPSVDLEKVEDMSYGDDMMMAHDEKMEDEECADDMLMIDDEHKEDEDMNDVSIQVDPATTEGKNLLEHAKITAELDLSTKEARAELRAKLAASMQFNPILNDAHRLADGQTQLDVKPSDSLGKVETIEEMNDAFMDVAQAPPKVRKEAERLNTLISECKVAVADLDQLVAQGLDSEVVKYWKQFWGQAGKEGSEFATELLKEHAKAQIDNEINTYKVKIARAYELANEMVRRGMVSDERSAITAQVEDIMTYNDEGFEAMKRVVNKHALNKSASFTLPNVGIIGNGESPIKSEVSLQEALDQAFSGNRRYTF